MARVVLVTVVCAAVLSGCSGTHDDEVRAAARGFYRAIAAEDGAAACRLLSARARSEVEQSAGASCDEGLLEEDLPDVAEPDEIQVFGTMAQVRWEPPQGGPGETVFLSRFDDGWLVTAAGCLPRGDHSAYDCLVSGG